jgi:linoleoyl-CoA desaturase
MAIFVLSVSKNALCPDLQDCFAWPFIFLFLYTRKYMRQQDKVRFCPETKSLFYPTLKKRVDAHFRERGISRHGDGRMIVKTIIFLSAYIIPFILLLIFTPALIYALPLWVVMGLAVSGIGMNIMHDANHGAYSNNPTVNNWLGYTLYLVGVGVKNWKFQHNVLHHTYTNVTGLDEDIRDRGVVKLSPHLTPGFPHRLQWVYAFFFYSILTLYWVTLKDFFQYFGFIKTGINRQSKSENRKMLAGLLLVKVLYFGTFLVLPVLVFGIPFGEVLLGFLAMHFTSGLILTVVFQLAHSVEGTAYPLPDSDGKLKNDWAVHQLETTVNFSPGNTILSWCLGGLNFQIEHHLFPKICHVHYPELSAIVRQTAEDFGLIYLENKTFKDAFVSHIKSLKTFGLPSLNEAIG